MGSFYAGRGISVRSRDCSGSSRISASSDFLDGAAGSSQVVMREFVDRKIVDLQRILASTDDLG